MTFTSLIRPLMAGILHSFEPDHVTAVSVLATENAINKKKVSFKSVFKASQWAEFFSTINFVVYQNTTFLNYTFVSGICCML